MRKPPPGMTHLDGKTIDEATEIIKAMTKPEDKVEPKYLHLRRYCLHTHEYLPTGGITLAYEKHGDWYKVGAAFCSLRDQYQKGGKDRNGKSVGRDLAKERLWSQPCWIPVWCWDWLTLPDHLDSHSGRSWLTHAMRHGLNQDWELKPIFHATTIPQSYITTTGKPGPVLPDMDSLTTPIVGCGDPFFLKKDCHTT